MSHCEGGIKENYFYKKRLACLSWQGCQSRGTAKSCCFVRKYFWLRILFVEPAANAIVCVGVLCPGIVSYSPVPARLIQLDLSDNHSKLPFKRYQAPYGKLSCTLHTPYLQYCIVTALSRDVCKWLILGVPGKRLLE